MLVSCLYFIQLNYVYQDDVLHTACEQTDIKQESQGLVTLRLGPLSLMTVIN